jgi:Protein of unknown function (DUF4007)
MARGPLFQDGYRHQFSGHETFPLRYGWLKKAFDQVQATEEQPENKWIFLREDSIARFGVGKNMVASMRHWATATGIIEESANQCLKTTRLGRKLMSKRGLDPFTEHPATLWLVHWQLAARPDKTTWFWALNHYPAMTFERETLIKGLERLAKERGWSRVAAATLKNDVACFIRTYVAQQPSGQAGNDDALESPLTELGLIRAVGRRDGFRFVRGPKATLGDGVFIYGLIDFWLRYSRAATLSFEAIAHEPGGPGRVFVLDENDVADRLVMLDQVTNGALRWSETAGLKQVVRDGDLSLEAALEYIDDDFKAPSREVA